MSNVGRGLSKVTKAVSKHSPLLLTIFGAVSVASTAVLAAKAAPKAKETIDDIQAKIEDEEDPEAIKHLKRNMYFDVAKAYAPAAINGALGIAAIIGAHKINTSRQIALAATCALTEKKFEDYQKEAKELLGEKKEAEIREKVAEKTADSDRFKNAPVVPSGDGRGEVLFFDEQSGRKFYSTHEKVDAAINALNAMRLSHPDEEIDLNVFYDELNMDNTGAGTMLGWRPYDKFSQPIRISRDYTSCTDEYDREIPCCMISFPNIDVLYDGVDNSSDLRGR